MWPNSQVYKLAAQGTCLTWQSEHVMASWPESRSLCFQPGETTELKSSSGRLGPRNHECSGGHQGRAVRCGGRKQHLWAQASQEAKVWGRRNQVPAGEETGNGGRWGRACFRQSWSWALDIPALFLLHSQGALLCYLLLFLELIKLLILALSLNPLFTWANLKGKLNIILFNQTDLTKAWLRKNGLYSSSLRHTLCLIHVPSLRKRGVSCYAFISMSPVINKHVP